MLTDTQCRTAKPKDKPYKLSDGKGLYLEIKPNGVKAWRYRFELREGDVAKESIFAIGDYAIAPSGENRKRGRQGGVVGVLLWPRRGGMNSTSTRQSGGFRRSG
jgi:hypothetical protein